MARLTPPEAFKQHVRKISSPAPASQAGAPAPRPSVSSTPDQTAWSVLCARVRELRTNWPKTTLAVVFALGFLLATCLCWFIAPALACAQTLDAEVTDAEARAPGTPLRLLDAGLPAPTRNATDADPISPTDSTPLRVYLHEGELFGLGLLLGAALWRRTRRTLEAEPLSAPRILDTPKVGPTSGLVRSSARLGACSIAGNTRRDNQDRVWVGHVAGADVIVVADGLGGEKHGGEAAQLATTHAQARLEGLLPSFLATGANAICSLLLAVLWETAAELAREALAQGWTGADAGLRTTLILAVTTRDFHACVYLGDGGVFVLREGGEIVPLLEPHKDMARPGLLHGSLGPSVVGKPAWAITTRRPGDIVVAATDGIADDFGAVLAASIRTQLRDARGIAAVAARNVLDDLAARKDDNGAFSFTDNLTVAVVTTEAAS